MWHFKGTLWNSTQNILSIHWKIWFLYNNEILRALRFKSSYAFLKRPPGPCFPQGRILSTWVLRNDSKYKYCCLSSKLWYLQHNCVGDTIVYYLDSGLLLRFPKQIQNDNLGYICRSQSSSTSSAEAWTRDATNGCWWPVVEAHPDGHHQEWSHAYRLTLG